jgi:MFS family permease
MFRWYRDLSTADRRAFWGAYGGWGLDAMDVQIFSFLIPSLIVALGITRGEIGVLGTSVLIASAIGGWLGGILGDRFGRVRTMQITVIWYSIFTFLCGFATNFDQMLAFRVLQGIGFGGEWAAGAVLIGEIVKPEHRGKTVGCLGSAYAAGWGAAALLTSLVLALVPSDMAWRWSFWLGLLPAVLVIFIRRFVTEPEIFQEAKAAQASGDRVGSTEIFKSPLLARTLLACLLSIGLQGSVVTILTWLPTFLKTERGLSNSASGASFAQSNCGD